MTNTWLKCKVPYCDRQSHSCIINVHYVSYELTYIFLHSKTMCPCPSLSENLSLLCHTHEVQKMHHFIVIEFGCMNELVNDIINLVETLEHVVQMLAGYLLSKLPHSHWRNFSKVKASALWIICNGDEVSLLLLGAYGYDPTVSKVSNGHYTCHIVPIHMQCAIPFSCVLWHRCRHITTKDLSKLCVGVSTWVCWNIEMRTEDGKVGHRTQMTMWW